MKHIVESDIVVEAAQRCFRQFPTIILGSGASAPYNLPGMKKLRAHLLHEMKAVRPSDSYYENMKEIRKKLKEDYDLENALNQVQNISKKSLGKIAEWTWSCINAQDLVSIRTAINKDIYDDVGKLLLRMFESNHREANIITTNYDRVVEYICHQKGLYPRTGPLQNHFQIIRNRDNSDSAVNGTISRIVNIHKIHGSLDWFKRDNDGEIICIPASEDLPPKLEPLIVTPGITKLQRVHENPFRTIIRRSDEAIEASSAFLCVGFGFNDEHIRPKISQLCNDSHIPVMILSKKFTKQAIDFMKNDAGKNYMGVECGGKVSSNIYTYNGDGETKVSVTREPNLWSMGGFCRMVL